MHKERTRPPLVRRLPGERNTHGQRCAQAFLREPKSVGVRFVGFVDYIYVSACGVTFSPFTLRTEKERCEVN